MALLLGLGFVTCDVLAQQQGGFNFAARAREALAQPYTGITSSGSLRSGLYEIRKTGVSTAPVLDAVRDFLASLSKDKRKKILFPVDDPEWRNWANVHRFQRQGGFT